MVCPPASYKSCYLQGLERLASTFVSRGPSLESRCMTKEGWRIDSHSFILDLLSTHRVPDYALSAEVYNGKQSSHGPCPHGVTGQWEGRILNKWTQIYFRNYKLRCVLWKKRAGCLTENDWGTWFWKKIYKVSERKGRLCWDVWSARQRRGGRVFEAVDPQAKVLKQQRAWCIPGTLDKPTNDKWVKVEETGEMRAQEGPCKLYQTRSQRK